MNNTKFRLGDIMMIALVSTMVTTTSMLHQQSVYAKKATPGRLVPSIGFGGGVDDRKAPIVTSGDNIYIAWWTNKTGNNEVMFRASTDGGKTFGDKINLSNSTKAESQDAQIDTFGNNDNGVIVTWWERNTTSNVPVLKISTDKGATFGPLLKLSANGTIGSSGGG
jgi:hypothetical protein